MGGSVEPQKAQLQDIGKKKQSGTPKGFGDTCNGEGIHSPYELPEYLKQRQPEAMEFSRHGTTPGAQASSSAHDNPTEEPPHH